MYVHVKKQKPDLYCSHLLNTGIQKVLNLGTKNKIYKKTLKRLFLTNTTYKQSYTNISKIRFLTFTSVRPGSLLAEVRLVQC